jgi:hypothetical protein
VGEADARSAAGEGASWRAIDRPQERELEFRTVVEQANMRLVQDVVLVVLALALVGCPGRRPPGEVTETWIYPSREPRKKCDQYRTKDPARWSAQDKAESENECLLSEELRAYVLERQHCRRDEDCALVHADCPFGCMGIPVAASEFQAVAKKQDELLNLLIGDCRYKCDPVRRTVCRDGWCVAAR